MAYLEGDMPLSAAAEIGKRDTRRYAKRQFTWIANQMPDWPRVTTPDQRERVASALAVLNAPR
jgi:tRNA dimethylallyltransferase